MSEAVIANDRSNNIEIVRLSRNLGAEIRNLDLSHELTEDEFSIVHQAFLENEVLVFREQDIDARDQIAFGKLFGELSIHPFSPTLRANSRLRPLPIGVVFGSKVPAAISSRTNSRTSARNSSHSGGSLMGSNWIAVGIGTASFLRQRPCLSQRRRRLTLQTTGDTGRDVSPHHKYGPLRRFVIRRPPEGGPCS